MHHFITGVAGFIGSQLADALLADDVKVSGVDDFSRGKREHLAAALEHRNFRLFEADVSAPGEAIAALGEAALWASPPHLIWHLAANSDVAAGVEDPDLDIRRTLQTTIAVLKAARAWDIRHVAFASTSAVYGEREGPLTETTGPLLPISNYGATKLASEALLSAAAESALERIWIFRFPNVVGPRATHGALYDFAGRLSTKQDTLKVLGDGSQCKPYLHVTELIAAMKFIVERATERRNVFNIGPDGEGTTVAFMAEQMVARHAPRTPIEYTGGDRGWIGDQPRFRYATDRLKSLGWQPALKSDEAVLRAIGEIDVGRRA